MGTRFMSVGKGKDRKAFPITKPKGTSKTRFNKKPSTTKSRFKVPTLPNDPPRTKLNSELPDFSINRNNWKLEFEDDEISFSLDDFGWSWSGEGDQFNTFLARMAGSSVWNDLASDLEEEKITVDMIKPHLLKNLEGKLTGDNDDGLYSISGDNTRWKFHQDDDLIDVSGETDFALSDLGLKEDEKAEFVKEFWNHIKSENYDQFLEDRGNFIRDKLKKDIQNAKDYDDLQEAYEDAGETADDEFREFQFNEEISPATHDAVNVIKARRNEQGEETGSGKSPEVFEDST